MANKAEQYANSARSTLNGAINNSVTSLVVASGTPFPSAGNFRLKIDDEIMIVGARSGTTLSSITRGAEGTTAASHADGAAVTSPLTAASVRLAGPARKIGATFHRPYVGIPDVWLPPMPYKGLITAWEVIGDVPGTNQFDVWLRAATSFPPTVAQTITASDKPKTTAAIRATGSCTGWTTDFAVGDVFMFHLDSTDALVTDIQVLLTVIPTE